LAEYYRSIGLYQRSIEFMNRRVDAKRCSATSGLGWALEELGDILCLHACGAIRASVSDEAKRERFAAMWKPESEEDVERVKQSGCINVYSEAAVILSGIFGDQHEHTQTIVAKRDRLVGMIR
jgi:hypothetical protein